MSAQDDFASYVKGVIWFAVAVAVVCILVAVTPELIDFVEAKLKEWE